MTATTSSRTAVDFDPTDPASFSFWTEERLRYGDLDMLAHVNNNAIGVFLENGRVHLFRASGEDIAEGLSWVVRRLEIDFVREIQFPGTVRTGTRVAALGNTSCTIRQGIFVDGECRVTSTAIGVCFDLVARKSVSIPDVVRTRLAAHRP
ncbi:Predicted thioesterase [alpha proteobacterium BAL199]|jgi:acyl-CoA thioester hydrolase|nr:Predicted thioesterase [alpha proteobacterium BAL199]